MIATAARELQPQKALLPMAVTELGIATAARALQLEKAPRPMVVTESEIDRDGGQRAAAPEGVVTDSGDGIRDCHDG